MAAAAGAAAASLLAPAAAWADCNADIGALREKTAPIQAALDRNKKAHGGKIDPVAACSQLKALAAVQREIVSYLTKNKDWCSVPDDALKGNIQSQAQVAGFAVKACEMVAKMKEMQAQQAKVAAQQAVQVPTLKLPAGPL
jgi:hypothetical protein